MSAVYPAICAVMADIGQTGITKNRKNQQQGYSFRGIDDVYNELNSLLSKHKLIVAPRILSRDVVERQTAKGGVLFYVTIEAEFDLVSAEDGSRHTVRTFGEAMDSGDKATNKAMSAAYKYAAMMLFCIPTEGDNDADATTHEIAPAKRTVGFKPDGTRTSHSLKGDKAWEKLKADLDNEMLDVSTEAGLNTVREHFRERARKEQWNASYMFALSDVFEGYSESIRNGTHPFPGDVRIGGKTLSTLDAG